jgi:biopolymer transport protein TolR
MGRHRKELPIISQIDVTPLVDITFILLIVFMITAPALEQTLDITPPELSATEIPEKDAQLINIDKTGDLIIKGKKLPRAQLGAFLATLDPKTPIFLRGDESRAYGEIINVLKEVKHHGFKDVSLITVNEQ